MLTRFGHVVVLACAALFAACGPENRDARPAAVPAARASASTVSESAPLPDLLARIKAAYQAGDYNRGLTLVKTVLETKGINVNTYDRLGSVYFALGRYGDALSMWGQALPLEQDLGKRRQLRDAIASTRRSLNLPDEPLTQAGLSAEPSRDKRPPVVEVQPVEKSKRDPRRSRDLYKQGVKQYAEGAYLEATSLFQQALELDPGNEDAKKALERLRLGS